MTKLGDWIDPRPMGIYLPAADIWIDPVRAGPPRAGDAWPCRSCPGRAWRGMGDAADAGDHGGALRAPERQPLDYGERITLHGIDIRLVPAGHVLGSAQIVLEHRGERIVVSGDYKRREDPTCEPFEPVPCDVFITEATFGLPVFRHPETHDELDKLLAALRANPDRCVLVGAYALGKAQR